MALCDSIQLMISGAGDSTVDGIYTPSGQSDFSDYGAWASEGTIDTGEIFTRYVKTTEPVYYLGVFIPGGSSSICWIIHSTITYQPLYATDLCAISAVPSCPDDIIFTYTGGGGPPAPTVTAISLTTTTENPEWISPGGRVWRSRGEQIRMRNQGYI